MNDSDDAHKIDKIPKTENRELIMGIMERLETSADRKNNLKKGIIEGELEEFVRGCSCFS
jgi:hypothetical protein